MNNIARAILFIAFALAVPAAVRAQAPAPSPDTIVLRNGDLLYGKLLAIDGPNAIRWQHPDATEPIDFRPDNIAQIDFPASKNSTPRSENACRVLLDDGDAVEGELVGADPTSINLQTWYAGRLTIPRDALQSLVFLPRSPAVVDGITGLEGWTQGKAFAADSNENGRWIYRNGAFYADKEASIARDVKLPDVAEVQFDLAWKGGLNFAVALYTDSLVPILLTSKEQGPKFGGFYSLRFQYNAFIDLWAIKKMDPLRRLGQLYIPSLNAKSRLHVTLRMSKPQHRIVLWLDGKPVKDWVDPEAFAGEGTGVRFVQNPPGTIKLSNLRITQWDGNFAETSDETEDTNHDIIWPENGAKVTGTIDYVADGKISATTPKGQVEFPLAMINAIDFSRRQARPLPTGPDNVRATFGQGDSLTFTLEKWRPDEMIIRSADFGKVRLNPAAFTRLQFLQTEKKPAEGPKS